MSDALLTVAISTLVILVGWVVGHALNVQRDVQAKRRELRLQYLLEAYRRLEDSAGRGAEGMPAVKRAFESAVADVQLFGSKEQIEALLAYLNQLKAKGEDRVDPLLKIIRNDIRNELRLETQVPEIHQFRFPIPAAAPSSPAISEKRD